MSGDSLKRNYQTDNQSFIVYKDWEEMLDALDGDEQVGQLFRALFAFAKRGEEAEFVGALKMAFIFMKNAIERDGEKWERTCSARSDCGKLGGRPPKAKEAKEPIAFSKSKSNQKNQMKAKEADNVNVNDNVTDNDNVIVNVNDNVGTVSFGESKNVKLTQDQYNSLVCDYGEDVISDYVNRIDNYINSNNITPYNNHYQTVVDWLRKDKVEKKPAHSFDITQVRDAITGKPLPR